MKITTSYILSEVKKALREQEEKPKRIDVPFEKVNLVDDDAALDNP